jgi:hypothetical protein
MKQLQRTIETDETFEALETCLYSHIKHMQHPDLLLQHKFETSETRENKHLKHTCAVIANIHNI